VIGNPTSGADSLMAVLEHPDLLSSHIIESVVVVQGVMNGAKLADLVVGGCTEVNERFCRVLWGFTEDPRRFVTTESASEFQAVADRQTDDQVKLLQAHVYYVRGATRVSHMHESLAPGGMYLKEQAAKLKITHINEPQDGVTFAKDQWLHNTKVSFWARISECRCRPLVFDRFD